MYSRFSHGNGFLDVDNKAELEKLKQHESALQRQSASIRDMISKIDNDFFGTKKESSAIRETSSSAAKASHRQGKGWGELKMESDSLRPLTKGPELAPQITETQRYIQSLKEKRTATVKERVQERAQMLEQMEDMRQHALYVARKKEAEAIAQNFFMRKCRLRALKRLQNNANHRLRQSYAVIRSNMNRQRKALMWMCTFLHDRCVARAKGVLFELRMAWQRFAKEVVPKIQNRDWLFVQCERATLHHRKSQLRRHFAELANTKTQRSHIYAKAKKCHQRLVFQRFLRAARPSNATILRQKVLADLVSKTAAKQVQKTVTFLVEACRLSYQRRHKKSLLFTKAMGRPLLDFLYSDDGEALVQQSKAFALLLTNVKRCQQRKTRESLAETHFRRHQFRQFRRAWATFKARKVWFERLPVATANRAAIRPKPQKTPSLRLFGGSSKGRDTGNTTATNTTRVHGDRLLYLRLRRSSLKRWLHIYINRYQDTKRRRTVHLPTIQRNLYSRFTGTIGSNGPRSATLYKDATVDELTALILHQQAWQRLVQGLHDRQQARLPLQRSEASMERSWILRMRRFFTTMRHRCSLSHRLRSHLHRRSLVGKAKYFKSIVEQLRTNIHRQKLHRMGMRYYQKVVYARFLAAIFDRAQRRMRLIQTVKISPRHHRLVYLAFHTLRQRIQRRHRKMTLIRSMRSRVYSELMRKYLKQWLWQQARAVEQTSVYARGKAHDARQRRGACFQQWITWTQGRLTRQAKFRQAEKVTLPNLARYCLKEWKAVTQDSLYFNVTQYQKGQLLWKTSIQRRYLHIWAENTEEEQEQEEHIEQFHEDVHVPLARKRALRLWNEYVQRKAEQRQRLREGEALAVQKDACLVLREWQQRICVQHHAAVQAYAQGRQHHRSHRLVQGIREWREYVASRIALRHAMDLARRHHREERQYRPALTRWSSMTHAWQRQRLASKRTRRHRQAQGWTAWTQRLDRLRAHHQRVRTNRTRVTDYRRRRHLSRGVTRLQRLVHHRKQRTLVKDFRRRQLIRRTFVQGFKVIWQQYNDAHAHEMQRARDMFLRRQQRRRLLQWVAWKRQRRSQRQLVIAHHRRRCYQQAWTLQWRQSFHALLKRPQKQAMARAKQLSLVLAFRRSWRRWRRFVQRRVRFLQVALSKLLVRDVYGGTWLTVEEADAWQRQRSAQLRDRVEQANRIPGSAASARARANSNTSTSSSIATAAANGGAPLPTIGARALKRTSSSSSSSTMMVPAVNAGVATLTRQWMKSRQLSSSRQVLRYLQQRRLVRRAMMHQWHRTYHAAIVKPQRHAQHHAQLHQQHVQYFATFRQWRTLLDALATHRRLVRLAIVHEEQRQQQVNLQRWYQQAVRRGQERRLAREQYLLAQYRVVLDTWRSRCRGVNDVLWSEVTSAVQQQQQQQQQGQRQPPSAAVAAGLQQRPVVIPPVSLVAATGPLPPLPPLPAAAAAVVVASKSISVLLPIVKPRKTLAGGAKKTSTAKSPRATKATVVAASTAALGTDASLSSSSSASSSSALKGAFTATLRVLYRHLLQRHPVKTSLRLTTRYHQRQLLQRAADHHDQRRLRLALRQWQGDAHRWAFHHRYVPVHELRRTQHRLWVQWTRYRDEVRLQRQATTFVAPHFHQIFHVQERCLPRWRLYARLSHAFHRVRKQIVTRRLWCNWQRIHARHRTMRRILQWMMARQKYQNLRYAWKEWTVDTVVERRLAQHVQGSRFHRARQLWHGWREASQRAKHVKRQGQRALRYHAIQQRSHVFTQLLALLERRYPQREGVKMAAKHHVQFMLRNTLTNLLALRRNRIAEVYRKRKAWQRLLVCLRVHRDWRHGVRGCYDQADVVLSRSRLWRWFAFAQASLAKKYAHGVLPRHHPTATDTLSSSPTPTTPTKATVAAVPPSSVGVARATVARAHGVPPPPPPPHPSRSTGTTAPPPPPPPPPPLSRTSKSTVSSASAAGVVVTAATTTTASATATDGSGDLLHHYTTYYWQKRQLQVLRRLQARVQARRQQTRQQQQLDTYHRHVQLYRAMHTHWLQDLVRRRQRLRKNDLVLNRYQLFLSLKRALRLWDVHTHVRPFLTETRYRTADRACRVQRMARGFRTLRWYLMERRAQKRQRLQQQPRRVAAKESGQPLAML